MALTTLAGFALASQIGRLASVMIDDQHLKQLGKVMIATSAVGTLAICLALYDEKLFVYLISINGVVSVTYGSVFGMRYDQAVRLSKNVDFENVQKMEKFLFAASGLIIGGIAMLMYKVGGDFILYVGILGSVISTSYAVWTYINVWSKYDSLPEKVKEEKKNVCICKCTCCKK